MKLYHGSEKIVETPQFGADNPRNDYGLGVYCTQNLELAKEWACQKNADGYASDFLENAIPLQNLASSMELGELGMQVVLKFPKAFFRLMYTQSFRAEKEIYFKKYQARDTLARKAYFEGYRKTNVQDAIYLIDIFRNPELLHGIEL